MERENKETLGRILLAAILCGLAWALPWAGPWRLAAFLVPYLLVGYDVLWSAVQNILHGEIFDEELLMTLATLGAFALGEYPEAAGVMLFYQLGELFQDLAVGKSRRSIAALMDIRPDHAVVLRGGAAYTVAPQEVEVGETVLLRPGERVPLDGTILEGQTTVDTAALTGESLPVDKTVGDRLVSGSINLSGVVKLRTESLYAESTVAKILELAETAASKKARAENFITRFSRVYTPSVVLGAVLLALLPPLVLGLAWSDWLRRALIFLMVSCPCALVVSVPLSFFGGIGGASRDGILIKGAGYLEALAGVDTLVFDKTGTLTKGSFAVDAIHPTGIDQAALLDIAAAAESRSTHPVAESIVQAHQGHIAPSRIGSVTEYAGLGLLAEVDGARFYVGNGALMDKAGADWRDCHLAGTGIHIARDSEYLGHIVISDQLKPDSQGAIQALKDLGVRKTVMLTGDTEKVARAVGTALGVDQVYAGLLPAQKVERVEELLAAGHKLAFVGDGINDAPVLARANVGIAMGAMGSDAAIESADIVLMDDKLSKLPKAMQRARRTMAIVRQNIAFALGIKAVVLLLGAVGMVNMWAAVFADVGVMILATLNAMRAMLPMKQ